MTENGTRRNAHPSEWDARHASGEPKSVDPWLRGLAAAVSSRPEGPLLDVACGLGQNTLWLASLTRGTATEVVGVDSSAVALGRGRDAARAAGLTVRFEQRDLESEGLPAGPWAAVAVLHYLDRELFGSLAASLSPGGLLFFKTHLAHPLRDPELGPKSPSRLLGSGELLWSFPTLEPLHYHEWAGSGRAFAGLLARKPTLLAGG